MELSEAKEILKDMKESMEQSKKDITIKSVSKACEDTEEAIDTVLKALDNSISKEYHEMTIKEQNNIIYDLKSKLDNSVSKDEIRKKIEQLEFLRDDAIEDNLLGDAINLKERIDELQELLGE